MTKPFITKELLENCTVELDEKYTLMYSIEDGYVHIVVGKIKDDVLTIVLNDTIKLEDCDA